MPGTAHTLSVHSEKTEAKCDSTRDSGSELESDKSDNKELGSDWSEPESEFKSKRNPDGLSDRVTNSSCQENFIYVDRLSGSTTIIVNANAKQQSPSVCQQSRAFGQQVPPMDISSGPLQPPTQPRIHFPACSFGQGQPRAFLHSWYRNNGVT